MIRINRNQIMRYVLAVLLLFVFTFGIVKMNERSTVLSAAMSGETNTSIKSEKSLEVANDISKQKEQMIKGYTDNLENKDGLEVLYGAFIDEVHYVYIVKDQKDNEKLLVVQVGEQKAKLLFKVGDFEGKELKQPINPISQIEKIVIENQDDSLYPNICIYRSNEKYTKVQILEVNSKGVRYLGSCKKNNENESYSGEEKYQYLLDSSIIANYNRKSVE